MSAHFSLQEQSDLFTLMSKDTSDIILKTDCNGQIVTSVPAQGLHAFRVAPSITQPSLFDFASPSHTAQIKKAHAAVLASGEDSPPLDFPAQLSGVGRVWITLHMRRQIDSHGHPCGVLCMLRRTDDRSAMEEQVFAARMSDPLTGLTNQQAFTSMLGHLAENRLEGCLVLVDLDHFRSISLRYGQSSSDELLIAFADLLRTVTDRQDIISRIGGESFAILMPGANIGRAQSAGRHILKAMSQLGTDGKAPRIPVTASIAVTRIADTLDETLRQAELTLFLARTTGGNRVHSAGEMRPDTGRKGSKLLAFPRIRA